LDYIERFLKRRKNLAITVHYHALCQQDHRNIDEEELQKTVISGHIHHQKCQEFPEKPYDMIRYVSIATSVSRREP
jgi:UDP-2,3-diacylglucosamine pyrophosphatase LpxH